MIGINTFNQNTISNNCTSFVKCTKEKSSFPPLFNQESELNSLKSDDLSFFNDIIFVSCITSYYCTLDERKFSLLLDNTFKLLFNIGGVGCKKLMHFAISVLMIIIVLWFTQSTSHTFTARSHYYFIDQFTH